MKMMEDKQNLNKNTGKGTQAKTPTKCWHTTDTGQKNVSKITRFTSV